MPMLLQVDKSLGTSRFPLIWPIGQLFLGDSSRKVRIKHLLLLMLMARFLMRKDMSRLSVLQVFFLSTAQCLFVFVFFIPWRDRLIIVLTSLLKRKPKLERTGSRVSDVLLPPLYLFQLEELILPAPQPHFPIRKAFSLSGSMVSDNLRQVDKWLISILRRRLELQCFLIQSLKVYYHHLSHYHPYDILSIFKVVLLIVKHYNKNIPNSKAK